MATILSTIYYGVTIEKMAKMPIGSIVVYKLVLDGNIDDPENKLKNCVGTVKSFNIDDDNNVYVEISTLGGQSCDSIQVPLSDVYIPYK